MSRPRLGHPSDILVVPANADCEASDYITADVHGNHAVFEKLNANRHHAGDRLFFAGDLVDRGTGNVEIVRAIIRNNADTRQGKIYSVRGNHEQLCLETINALSFLTKVKLYGLQDQTMMLILYALKKQSCTDSEIKYILKNKHISYFIKPSFLIGKRIFDDFCDESKMTKNKYFESIMNDAEFKAQMDSVYGDLVSCVSALSMHERNGGKWLLDLYFEELANAKISAATGGELKLSEDSDIAMIYYYMRELPYIIHVQGEKPFNIVHADMPISTKKLLNRVVRGKGLSEHEKEYALWARALHDTEIKIKKITGCRRYSIPTIVGHTIDGGVRAETNTMNLDVAAFIRDCTVMVKMPECKVLIVKSKAAVEGVDRNVLNIASNVQSQLDLQEKLKKRRERHQEKRQKRKLMGLFTHPSAVNDCQHSDVKCTKKKN